MVYTVMGSSPRLAVTSKGEDRMEELASELNTVVNLNRVLGNSGVYSTIPYPSYGDVDFILLRELQMQGPMSPGILVNSILSRKDRHIDDKKKLVDKRLSSLKRKGYLEEVQVGQEEEV